MPRRILTLADWTMSPRKMRKRSGNSANPFFALSELDVDAMHFDHIHDGGMTRESDKNMCMLLTSPKKDC